ncbi:MAG: DUF3047 domain-containing protein [Desulfobulbaceae bacterium]|nr:DUF3047 domain-containing protein [Desulfobulbaceae bacterium]HIJ78045.1 DUF3047 domain-containing protein [Deltaproteobacteria bacterium]
MQKKALLHAIIITLTAGGLTLGATAPGEQILDDYRAGIAPGWQPKIFSGQTHYRAEKNEERAWIQATSTAAASGLFYKIDYAPQLRPILKWSWKIDHILKTGDARTKAGDDYPARIYVVFPSVFFWKTKALNYIWANRLPVGRALPNAYTANAMMIAVESGPAKTGQWVTEERNIYEDYKLYFGEEPGNVGAIAIMTDTDNTGENASAGYGPIIIGAAAEPPH